MLRRESEYSTECGQQVLPEKKKPREKEPSKRISAIHSAPATIRKTPDLLSTGPRTGAV
jgi:hypothetical protein